jgi:uncharacterized protein
MQGVEKLSLTNRGGAAVLAVKAVPGSSRNRIAGVLGDALKVTVSAAAEKGKANKAIADLLAEALDLPARNITLVSGPTSPRKEFALAGLSADEVRRLLSGL